MRSLTTLVLGLIAVGGCGSEQAGAQRELEAAPASSRSAPAAPEPAAPAEVAEAIASTPAPAREAAPPAEAETNAQAPPPAETEAKADVPDDPLAPILPSAPEPGSPEADAELQELLEESTLTQEEFDRGFRGGGPQLHGDQFVFGPNSRIREPPE